MGCPACQVVFWNNRVIAMLQSVNTLATTQKGSPVAWPGDAWAAKWWELVKETCEQMGPLVTEATGVQDY